MKWNKDDCSNTSAPTVRTTDKTVTKSTASIPHYHTCSYLRPPAVSGLHAYDIRCGSPCVVNHCGGQRSVLRRFTLVAYAYT